MRLTHSGRSSVLLAESDRTVAERVLSAVRRACFDCDVVVVPDGMAAIEFIYAAEQLAARGLARTPDLVLLARNLPELDGLKVAKQLHWTHRDDLARLPPIVVYSRSQTETEAQVEEACRCGINSYLILSDADPRFGEEIQQTFIYWLYLNRAAKLRRRGAIVASPGEHDLAPPIVAPFAATVAVPSRAATCPGHVATV